MLEVSTYGTVCMVFYVSNLQNHCECVMYCGSTRHIFWCVQDTLTQSQDKAFRRIDELKEQIQLDHLAKLDVENNYRMLLEDRDEMIKVLKMQVVRMICKIFTM